VFTKSPDGPTTEVSLLQGFRQDLYTVIGTLDPQTKRGTFRFHVNPLVAWIWIGGLVLVLGATVSLWPELSFGELGAWSYVRAGAGVAAGTVLSLWLAMSPNYAYASVKSQAKPPPTPATVASLEVPAERAMPPLLAGLFGLGLGTLFVARRRRPDDVRHGEPRV
jgi:hypothetical protein